MDRVRPVATAAQKRRWAGIPHPGPYISPNFTSKASEEGGVDVASGPVAAKLAALSLKERSPLVHTELNCIARIHIIPSIVA